MAQEAVHLLERNVAASMLSFITAAEEGACLILERNREGFSIQVTEAVQKSTEDLLDLVELKAWQEKLSTFRRRA